MADSFALDLKEWTEKVARRSDDAVGEIVANIAAEVDFRSPVGDPTTWIYNRGTKEAPDYVDYLAYNDLDGYVGGRFRANWQLGIGAVVTSTNENTDRSAKNRETGGVTTGRIIASIPEDAAGKVYFLSNSLPYAQRIEHGWSHQAPAGVVGLTAVRFQDIVDRSVARAKAENP